MRRTHILLATGLVAALASCGDDDAADSGSGSDAARTVEIEMVDIAFEPDTVEVEAGETIRFVFTNNGTVMHDAFIGDEAAQEEHGREMRDAESDGEHGGGGHGDGGDAITVEPGDTGEITYTFDEPGTLEIGCHEPGHYEAGMRVSVEVG